LKGNLKRIKKHCYPCRYCFANFQTRGELAVHIRDKHRREREKQKKVLISFPESLYKEFAEMCYSHGSNPNAVIVGAVKEIIERPPLTINPVFLPRGAGRPRTEKTSFVIKPELKEWLRVTARKYHTSICEILEQSIRLMRSQIEGDEEGIED
jgi:hypothetical protein